MNKENSPSNLTSRDCSQEKSIDIEQSKLKDSYTEKIKDTYLSQLKIDYPPSEESIERANGLDPANPNSVSESSITNAISNS
ncbi:hypothetical protein DIC82_02630 [Clostridium beijerinckii]|nr:hypothetical protein DIC82_02630 [Clostridium beijerinckii]